MSVSRFRFLLPALALVALPMAATHTRAAGPSGDWPMWGGTPIRNMVSDMKGLPVTWDIQSKKNVRWMAALGSQSYGNPVVSGGKVFLGTNNEGLRDPKQAGDRGVLMAFGEKDGAFLWQITHEKLASGRANDWPYQGVASSPLVEGDRLYYVSNRCELLAVDTEGFKDGENDGPYKDEKLTSEHDGDIVWKLDMMDELGVMPHNLANSSPISWGDLIYVSTSNGQDESHVNIPSPRAPAIIAVDKKTGKVVWEDASPGDKILHGQWGGITVAEIGGVTQVIHPQGDGWIRSFEAKTGQKLWEFDANPKESVWPKTRNELIATPVVYEGLVYIGNGQDPSTGRDRATSTRSTPRSAATSRRAGACGTSTRSAARSRPPRSRTASSTSPTSAASSTRSTPRREPSTGLTTCSPRCGLRRCSWTARSTWATRTATWWCSRPARRRRSWPRTRSAARSTRRPFPRTARSSS